MSRGLLRNSLSNFVGGLIPALATLVTVPVVIGHLGAVQYGIFVLLTSVVGYFSMLDINVSAGSTKYLSEYHARGEHQRASEVVSCGALIYLAIGLVGCICLFFGAAWVLRRFFDLPGEFRATTVTALEIGGVAFLFGQLQAYLISVPQALLRYDISARYESLFGVLVSVVTMGVAIAGGGLVAIMLARTALSLLNCVLLLAAVRSLMPLLSWRLPPRGMVSAILSFSGFAYLSRIAAVTYQNADKLIIGALADMRSVALFSVPFMLANRVFGMVYRLGHALFPLTSALASQGRQDELRATYLVATRYMVYLNACLCVLLCLFAREVLHYWAGHEFGVSSARILTLVALAVFIDSLTNLPSLVNDGLGRPRNTGLFAVARAALAVVAVYALVLAYGVEGAAVGQLATSFLMASGFLLYVHERTVPVSLWATVREAYGPAFTVLAVFMPLALGRVGGPPAGPVTSAALILGTGLVLLAVGWLWVLNEHGRRLVLARLRAVYGQAVVE
ncbi:MAG: oligosaccharide flippase family protein [Gammaproteobacteria bacterium]|nr:oligosaccharide flippase family protein [Gammaproteobacteria bacterium]